jgi:hypothetical protein
VGEAVSAAIAGLMDPPTAAALLTQQLQQCLDTREATTEVSVPPPSRKVVGLIALEHNADRVFSCARWGSYPIWYPSIFSHRGSLVGMPTKLTICLEAGSNEPNSLCAHPSS